VSAFDRHPLKRLRSAFCAILHLAMSPHRHPLLTIRNLTPCNTDRMFKHERDYSEENSFPRTAQTSIREKNSDQRKVEENLDHPPVVPRISPHLLCEGTQFLIFQAWQRVKDNTLRMVFLANAKT
jgi:hypothetical protein